MKVFQKKNVSFLFKRTMTIQQDFILPYIGGLEQFKKIILQIVSNHISEIIG